MKTIDTLVEDIYSLAEGKSLPDATKTHSVGAHFSKWFETREPRDKNVIYFSEVGDTCLRRLWYKINAPSSGEAIDGKTKVKFLYGDVLEDIVLRLTEAAGHSVEDEQKKVRYDIGDGWYLSGRIDAVVDGILVDVKSVTKNSEEKFKWGLKDDPFGYYGQLNGYAVATGNSNAGFLTIQKELGHINYYPIVVSETKFVDNAKKARDAASLKTNTLATLSPVPQSPTSKNYKLCVTCSYCAYKKECFPGLRTFLYAKGPEYLTLVVDVPKVPEIV